MRKIFVVVLTVLLGTGTAVQASDSADKATRKKISYQNKVESELQSLDQKVAHLRDRSQHAGETTRRDLDQAVNLLDAKLTVVRRNLEDLKNSTTESWTRFRKGLDRALGDARRTYTKTASKFKSEKE